VWERRLLRHLAVFRGGFTIDAAIAVASGGGADSLDVVRGIRNLVAKSLVATEGSPVSRWRLLETTRAYASRELDAQGETDEALRRHAQYFRDLAARPASESSRSDFLSIVVQHSREIDNVRAALEWSFSPVGDTAIGIALAAGYAPVWLYLSLLPETKDQVERALARLRSDPEAPQLIQMKLQFALGLALVFTMGPAERIKSALGFALDACDLRDVNALQQQSERFVAEARRARRFRQKMRCGPRSGDRVRSRERSPRRTIGGIDCGRSDRRRWRRVGDEQV